MSDFPSVSKEQKHYLKALKRNLRLIQIARILLLFLFLGLWEFTARFGIIDSFIFSSPSQILKKNGGNASRRQPHRAHSNYPYRNPCKFLPGNGSWHCHCGASLGFSKAFRSAGTLSCSS